MRSSHLVLRLCCVIVLAFAAEAGASPGPSSPSAALAIDCGCFDRTELVSLHDRIVGAESLAEARGAALAPVLLARQALSRARWLAPRSEAIRAAEARLVTYEGDVRSATSGAEVGRRYAELVRLDLDGELGATEAPFIGEPSACAFSTLEIVAIVLGFILGIIPGIILLLILC